VKTINLKELRNALSCWQDDYDCDDDKEQYDMFGAAIDAVSRLEAAELEIEGLKRFQELNLKIKQAMHERFTRAERERDELRAEQAEHDEQIARMESKFSLAKRALDSKTARCEKAEAELRRRDPAAGGVSCQHKWMNSQGRTASGWLCEKCGDYERPIDAQPAVLPPEMKPEPDKYDVIDHGFIAGYNKCRSDALVLGAQQQKVVELPEPVKWPEIPFKYFSEEQVFSMLDAAGVKWEVKK